MADGPKDFEHALVQHGELVELLHDALAVSHQDHGDAARLESGQCRGQRRVTFFIEIGVRLIEDHQPRVPVQRARQRDALTLAAREQAAAIADLGVVALGQPQDEIVRLRQLRGADHRLRIRLLQPRDVGGNAAGEQLHLLR